MDDDVIGAYLARGWWIDDNGEWHEPEKGQAGDHTE